MSPERAAARSPASSSPEAAPAFASVVEFGEFLASAFNLDSPAPACTLNPPPPTPSSPKQPRSSRMISPLTSPSAPHLPQRFHPDSRDPRLSSYFESDTETDADEAEGSPSIRARRRKRESSTTTGTATTASSLRSATSRIFKRASALVLRPARSSPGSHGRTTSDGQGSKGSAGQRSPESSERLQARPSAPTLRGTGTPPVPKLPASPRR